MKTPLRLRHPAKRLPWVGATPAPHQEILEQVVDTLAAQGITLEIVPYTDYLTPNVAVEEGEDDANFFQHITYMETYNAENNTHLVNAGSIHYEPMGIYAGKTTSLEEIPDGAVIAVPNDACPRPLRKWTCPSSTPTMPSRPV